jgi:hypothetical protein
LEDLIDFEAELARSVGVTEPARREVLAAGHGLSGAAARRWGLRVWLEHMRHEAGPRHGSVGRRFSGALALVTTVLGVLLWLAGIGAVLGLVDHERVGMNVTLAMAVLLGGQWLLLVMALFGWLVRRRAGDGFSLVQMALGKLVRRLAGGHEAAWWHSLTECGGPRTAVLWRLARIAQSGGIAFNGGILCGLAGLVLVKHVGFFWETTTDGAMRAGLETVVNLLASPWAGWWPAAVPDGAVIDASRWLPGRAPGLVSGPAEWWLFLLLAVLVWGLFPRAILWWWCWRTGRRALATLDFQGRSHRMLWRDLTGPGRVDVDEKPLDGVLVLDVGGTGLPREVLRPFLLRRLRVHPAAWESVAVLDPGAELLAAKALAQAPAGVVLLAEGWALSPPRMTALHRQIRTVAGADIAVKFLVANVGPSQQPLPPTAEERREWERFVDALKDPAVEVFSFEDLPPLEE